MVIIVLLLLLVCSSFSTLFKPIKTVIVGSGPGGLLTSHALLSKYKDGKNTYDVQLIESRDDPRFEPQGPRSYSLGLNIRGQTAIKYFDKPGRSFGLWHGIRKEGVFSETFWLHIGKLKLNIRKPVSNSDDNNNIPPPTLMIPRNKLVQGLVDVANSTYGDRFKIKYNTKCTSIDIKAKVAYFSDGTSLPYDLLIGADGANSEIRNALATQSNVKVEENILPGQYKVMLQPLPATLEPEAIHAMECTSKDRSNIGLFIIPAPNNNICALVNWRNSSNIPNAFIQENTDPSNIAYIQDLIEKDFPLFGRPTEQAVLQLQEQKPSVALTIKCDNYADKNVCILGDAAHSTGGTLGQGCNSALLDVVELDKVLEDTNDNISEALTKFSMRQQPEGSALLTLLSLPPKNAWGIPYNLIQLIKGFLSKFLPFNFLKPTQTLLSQTLLPFTQIVALNKFWLNKV